MGRNAQKHLTELELQIMKVIWPQDEVCVDEIKAKLAAGGKELALPSIRTMLNILEKKGAVSRRPSGAGRKFLYKAEMEQAAVNKEFLDDVVNRVFEGSTVDLFAALLDTQDIKKKDIDQVKRLIDQIDRGK
ncbi:MAG: BlaI/MecI/CopY family transcriptional regulator [Verrucomicrobiota bacterium]